MHRFSTLLLIVCAATLADTRATLGETLTGPASGDPLTLGLEYLERQAPALGIAPDDLAGLVVTDNYRSSRSGVTHVYLRQTWMGLEIDGADGAFHVLSDGSILTLHHDAFLRGLAPRNHHLSLTPTLSPIDAVAAAAAGLGLAAPTAIAVIEESLSGVDRRVVLSDGEISRKPGRRPSHLPRHEDLGCSPRGWIDLGGDRVGGLLGARRRPRLQPRHLG